MSDRNGIEQELAYSQIQNGTNANNDKEQQKKKSASAFVQIAFDGPTNPVKTRLSQNCSTVAEQIAFLLEKINDSQGNLLGLELNCRVVFSSVLEGDEALIDHNIPLEEDSNYTFKFKLAYEVGNGHKEDKEKEELKNLVEEQAGKVAKLDEELAKLKGTLADEVAKSQAQMDQFKHENNALKKLLEEANVDKVAKLTDEQAKKQNEREQRKVQEEIREEKRMAELLESFEHGTMPKIIIRSSQYYNKNVLVQRIVNMLATAKKPEKVVGEGVVEANDGYLFHWPKRNELIFKSKRSSFFYGCLAEYELTNRGCRFQVLIYYSYWQWDGNCFDNYADKFIYRRLP